MELLDRSIAKLREGGSKFDEASKTNLDAPLKEYLSLKSQEFNKHAEHLEVEKDMPRAITETSVQDIDALRAKFNETKEHIEKLQKEWSDFAERANKIQEQNKDKFKS